jgi:hypothetical protein
MIEKSKMIKLFFLAIVSSSSLFAISQNKESDRRVWLANLDRIARPVLSNLAQAMLKEKMPVELSKTVDNKENRKQASYLEAFGRTLSGIAPWLELEGGNTEEIKLREQYRQWTLKAIATTIGGCLFLCIGIDSFSMVMESFRYDYKATGGYSTEAIADYKSTL